VARTLNPLNPLTKASAGEYGPSVVRVNAVSPGPTRTEGSDAMGEGLKQLAAQARAVCPATADEIANAIAFLAIARSSFIQGARLASTEDAPPSEMSRRFRACRRTRNASSQAHWVPAGMDLAHCPALNWTEGSAEPLLRMIAFEIRVCT
jgi:Enoyl-(Acyl carrier protein) reductase